MKQSLALQWMLLNFKNFICNLSLDENEFKTNDNEYLET